MEMPKAGEHPSRMKLPFVVHFRMGRQRDFAEKHWGKPWTFSPLYKQGLEEFDLHAAYFGGGDLRIYPIGHIRMTMIDEDRLSLLLLPFPGYQSPGESKRVDLASLPFVVKAGMPDPWDIFHRYVRLKDIFDPIIHPYKLQAYLKPKITLISIKQNEPQKILNQFAKPRHILESMFHKGILEFAKALKEEGRLDFKKNPSPVRDLERITVGETGLWKYLQSLKESVFSDFAPRARYRMAEGDEEAMRQISEQPGLLHDKYYLDLLIRITTIARYSTDGQDRASAIRALKQLIPKRPKGRKLDVPPEGRELLMRFIEKRHPDKNPLQYADSLIEKNLGISRKTIQRRKSGR
jgi:hypothetical protein